MIGFRITYHSVNSSASGSSIPRGAIAGIVVGIVLGVIVFPILGFVLWCRRRRRRQRRKGDKKEITLIEPSIHKHFDITEVLDIKSDGAGQREKSSTQSPDSGISLDLFPVTIPQITNPQPERTPPTFPRSPTRSSPSPIRHLYRSSGGDVVRLPAVADQCLSVKIRNPLQINSEGTPSPGLNRRSTVPKPSGPRPPSYHHSIDDPRTSAFIPLARTSTNPTPIERKERPESEIQQVNEGERTTIYSFLDMNNSYSGPPSTIDGVGQSHNPNQSASHANPDSPRYSLVTGTNSTQSHRDPDRNQESRMSKPLSLSIVIQQPPTSKSPPPTELHPYSHYSAGYRLTPHSYRPRTGERASPTESIPFTTSEISEIRFSHPGEPSVSRPGSESNPQPPPPKTNTATFPIYRKLFGTLQGDVPPDKLLAKKRLLHRKALSAS